MLYCDSVLCAAGDVNSISVGDNTNLQDGVVVHVAKTALGDPSPTTIGSNVSVGALQPGGAAYVLCTAIFR